MKKLFFIVTLLFVFHQATSQPNKITLIFEDDRFTANTIDISYRVLNNPEMPGWDNRTGKAERNNGCYVWKYETRLPITVVQAGDLTKEGNAIMSLHIFEPGDSIRIINSGNGILKFEGRNTEKNCLLEEVKRLRRIVRLQARENGFITGKADEHFFKRTLPEYMTWSRYARKQMDTCLVLLEQQRPYISSWFYSLTKTSIIQTCENLLASAFGNLFHYYSKTAGIGPTAFTALYDSEFNNDAFNWLHDQMFAEAYDRQFLNYCKVFRKLNFTQTESSLPKLERLKLSFDETRATYKGNAREYGLARLIAYDAVHNGAMESEWPPEYDQFINAYYTGPYDPAFISYVKTKEQIDRRGSFAKYGYLINTYFSLPDTKGKRLDRELLKGKIAYINFWESGKPLDAGHHQVYDRFKNSNSIVFINISADTDSTIWVRNIRKYKLNKPGVINVYTSGLGRSHSLIKALFIDSFPQQAIADGEGRIFKAGQADVTRLISKELSKLHDGPYVFAEDSNLKYYSIGGDQIQWQNMERRKTTLTVNTDDHHKTFPVKLSGDHAVQPSMYARPEKLLAFSDIEGNFDAFRKLLQSNKVIDQQFNWIFGKGHLVFAGDMFDRGTQVTECLWLMYSLEEKARGAGGYVHYILGNHEIMNLQGNHRYTAGKYKKSAALMSKTLTALYSENSELGRWLRTKNIIEKIGDILFVHGGISPEMNRLPIGIEDINTLARPYFGTAIDSSNKSLLTIYSSKYGERYRVSPFWSRGYYKARTSIDIDKISNQELDTTLNKFSVRRIVTGHTLIADTISVHYGNKVINTDTHHARGKSEALLIEGDRYYRVNDKGDKVLLFIDDKLRR